MAEVTSGDLVAVILTHEEADALAVALACASSAFEAARRGSTWAPSADAVATMGDRVAALVLDYCGGPLELSDYSSTAQEPYTLALELEPWAWAVVLESLERLDKPSPRAPRAASPARVGAVLGAMRAEIAASSIAATVAEERNR